MKIEHWSLRLRVFLFFALLAVAAIAGELTGLYLGFTRMRDPAALDGFLFAGIIAVFVTLGIVVWIWLLFDEHVARPIQRLAGGLLARAHADVDDVLDERTARYLGDLAPAARAVTEHLARTRNKLAEAVAQETTRLIEEKEKLTALAAEMPHGVVLLSGRHKIAFYNGAAADLLGADHAPGLDHSVFDFLRARPLLSAYERLCAGEGDDGHVVPLTVATLHGGRILSARMRLMHAPSEGDTAPPYVLTLDDVTDDLAIHAEREKLLKRLFDRLRPSIASLRTTLDARAADAALRADARLDAALVSEMEVLTSEIAALDADYESAKADWWPMAPVRGSELCDALTAQLAQDGIVIAADVTEPIALTLDAVQITTLLAQLARRVTQDGGRALSFLASREEDGGAMLALGWSGEPLSVDRLESWLADPLDVGLADMTGRDILDAHGTEVWPEFGRASRAVLKLPIREARRLRRVLGEGRRAATYDFDLLNRTPSPELMETPLSELTYVVFDTETTGLLPSQGDEICQIAALRIVNGKVVENERLDRLVHPGRPIPASATAVHQITDEMVKDAPRIGVAGRQLHSFARGAVLVAHNAPFDLEFLRRHEAEIGSKFTNPVLDTVLLSAIVFGQSQEHTLDAISARLGVKIPPDARHTAMGDTIATAEVFIKMLRMAEERGIRTFGDALAEMRRHKRLLVDANQLTEA
ncbi:3'-5' exonuclease [Celeribacter indicus]|uniref:DNA-directed DNA polymerase n=1 Tax=Celeribacter indicus TaxID=1208324 RepID=A0A0B5DYW2_9RHOB|nr:exonuclease domain-containing protein [Celeribacter indicus]AJE48618.1 PAS domain/exonuclease domain-containing protein [Celeribacter indicus]SDX50896.1 DNA polymerase-3 subunit epsilon [Celeribacter indicus]